MGMTSTVLMEEAGDIAARVVRCDHRWTGLVDGERRCLAGCRAIALGSLAVNPPAPGIDWSQVVLVDLAKAREAQR